MIEPSSNFFSIGIWAYTWFQNGTCRGNYDGWGLRQAWWDMLERGRRQLLVGQEMMNELSSLPGSKRGDLMTCAPHRDEGEPVEDDRPPTDLDDSRKSFGRPYTDDETFMSQSRKQLIPACGRTMASTLELFSGQACAACISWRWLEFFHPYHRWEQTRNLGSRCFLFWSTQEQCKLVQNLTWRPTPWCRHGWACGWLGVQRPVHHSNE